MAYSEENDPVNIIGFTGVCGQAPRAIRNRQEVKLPKECVQINQVKDGRKSPKNDKSTKRIPNVRRYKDGKSLFDLCSEYSRLEHIVQTKFECTDRQFWSNMNRRQFDLVDSIIGQKLLSLSEFIALAKAMVACTLRTQPADIYELSEYDSRLLDHLVRSLIFFDQETLNLDKGSTAS